MVYTNESLPISTARATFPSPYKLNKPKRPSSASTTLTHPLTAYSWVITVESYFFVDGVSATDLYTMSVFN